MQLIRHHHCPALVGNLGQETILLSSWHSGHDTMGVDHCWRSFIIFMGWKNLKFSRAKRTILVRILFSNAQLWDENGMWMELPGCWRGFTWIFNWRRFLIERDLRWQLKLWYIFFRSCYYKSMFLKRIVMQSKLIELNTLSYFVEQLIS